MVPSGGTKTCSECLENLPLDSFEKGRGQCKNCRIILRKTKAKEVYQKNLGNIEEWKKKLPRPTSCCNADCDCETPQFHLRLECTIPSYRTECNYCHSKKARKAITLRAEVDQEFAERVKNKKSIQNKKHREKHPEKVKERNARHIIKRRTDPAVKIKSVISCAKQRKIEVVEEDIEGMKAKLSEPCVYCGKPPDVELSTLDRVDSDLGYSDKNTVPACKHCNVLKGCLPVDLFIHKARKIHERAPLRNLEGNDFDHLASTSKFGKPRSSGKKDKSVDISIEDAIEIWFSACTYCGIFPSFAVDRIDSDKNYTKDNVAPCCTVCNTMKKDMNVEELNFRVAKIVEHTAAWVLGDFRDKTLKDAGRPKKFLRVDAGGGRSVVFPSNRLNLGGKRSMFFKGTPATPWEFWEQEVTPEDCRGALERRLTGPS